MIKKMIATKISQIKFIQKIFLGKAIILMLHRIAPLDPNKIPANENMKVSPEFLEQFILDSKNKGYRFISLDDLYEGLLQNTLQEKSLIITIDDGYKDNLEFGYAVFKKHQIPFCIYVCTAFPERTHNMWWFGLEDYLLQNDVVSIDGKPCKIDSLELKQKAFLSLREIIISNSSNYQDATKIMNDLGIFYNPRDYDHLALSWEEIRYLAQDKLTTIGHHTHSHPIFNNLSKEEVKIDISFASELFKKHLGDGMGSMPKHFAYPFGSRVEVSKPYFSLLKDLGFHTATTTRSGSIYPAHKDYLSCLPRMFFHQNFTLESIPIRKKLLITD